MNAYQEAVSSTRAGGAARRAAALVLSLAMLAVAGCGGGDGESDDSEERPASVERDIAPATADPAVTTATEVHVTINPAANVAPKNKLFVFLAGTQGLPDFYRFIVRSGARRGFHTIGLNYPNSEAVGATCLTEPSSCFWDVRREVITGAALSPLVDIGTADSIVTRLTKAIDYLNRTYPSEGWGQYLVNGQVDWSKIVVGGHSQGGGHAGVMAKLYAMSRACYFSSPPDWSERDGAPASWTTQPNLTPVANQYAFGNIDDTLVPYDQLTQIWDSIGIPGAAESVDQETTFDSHRLTTAVPGTGNFISPAHNATVLDAATPVEGNGTPRFDSVWGYVCFN